MLACIYTLLYNALIKNKNDEITGFIFTETCSTFRFLLLSSLFAVSLTIIFSIFIPKTITEFKRIYNHREKDVGSVKFST